MNRKNLFWELTLRLEAFTHTVPVPFAVYYAVITQKMETEKWIIFVSLCLFFATGIGILGTIIRYFLVKNLFEKIQRIKLYDEKSNIDYTYKDKDYAKSVKLYIFKYPLIEAIIIVIRWFAGVIPIVSLYTYLVEYTPSVIRSGIFTIAMIPPISFVTYYFITENALRPLFEFPQIKNIEIKPDEIPKFDYFKRIVLAFFSLAALPVSVLSYLLYSVAKGETMVEEPLIPIVIVSSIFIVPLIVCSYVVAKTVRQGLTETSKSLDELAKGNFDVVVTPTSGDDFGQQAFFLSSVIQKLRGMYAEIRGLNEGLEEKVVQRTEELNKSLQEVRKLKFQQDGDYFLTYQLLNPLGFLDVKSNKIQIDFLLKQKKSFEFKGKEYDIGGDLNVAHTITLLDKKYVLFVNADAMGKSMQGAGGALVFGAVFQSLVQRTKGNLNFQNVSPDQWLASSFIEMQRIFEAFDGTMLVSMVIGLIEEESGILYFLSAEHPLPVLYRDGKASYITPDFVYHKLGTLGSQPDIQVKQIQLAQGDMIFAGSDGKDDIMISQNGNEPEVNLDDKFYLNIVEHAKGDPNYIFQLLSESGIIIDDISVIRIEYMGNSRKKTILSLEGKNKFKEAKRLYLKGKAAESIDLLQNIINSEPLASSRLQKDLAKLYYQNSDFISATKHAELYLKTHPEDDDFTYFTSKLYKKTGNIKDALIIAERIRNKSPKKSKYLVHLFHLYLKTSNESLAKGILRDLEILNFPSNDLARLANFIK
ncbi:MAG: SpoIIE family protein phosphatase [Leptospira sp.]|nr:SpoIIE family protein phosphatase [Leptospira sp.]